MKGTWTAPRIMAATGNPDDARRRYRIPRRHDPQRVRPRRVRRLWRGPHPRRRSGAAARRCDDDQLPHRGHQRAVELVPVPALTLGIDPPPGVPTRSSPRTTAPQRASTTTCTCGSGPPRSRWPASIGYGPAATSTAYINPRLAFGHESDYDYLHYVFAAMFGVGVLDVIMSRVLKRLQGRGSPGVALQDSPASIAPVDPFTPTDQGVRLSS